MGWYLATTTWREILAAAASVGRDVTPWLAAVPHLAGQELLARITPLSAHLVMEHSMQAGYGCGRRLVPSAVYTHGAERSSRAAFSYRIGMTMAEWATRGLLGLGPTFHTETVPPPGAIGWHKPGKRPDLQGMHSVPPKLWLVEAKGGRRTGLTQLKPGVDQLNEGGALLGSTPHRRVLCGTSIEDQVFVTIDDLNNMWTVAQPGPSGQGPRPSGRGPGRPEPGPRALPEERLAEDDDALVAVARAQMLIYWHLRYAAAEVSRSIVPLGRERQPRQPQSVGLLAPVDDDEATASVRRRLRLEPSVTARSVARSREIDDFLTAPVAGTPVRVGMSRRLFGACERLARSDRDVVDRIRGLDPAGGIVPGHRGARATATEIEEADARQVEMYRELDEERRERLRDDVRDGFNSVAERSWDQLTDRGEVLVNVDAGQQLEAATPDIYLAIDPSDPVFASAQG